METLTQRVVDAATESGADLVGFAPIGRFRGAPPALHPGTILPQTRTVVAVARKLSVVMHRL